MATYPVAVFQITGLIARKTMPDENTPRCHYAGKLLAWVHPGMKTTINQATRGDLRTLATQIMASRIEAGSGGPIAYLQPQG